MDEFGQDSTVAFAAVKVCHNIAQHKQKPDEERRKKNAEVNAEEAVQQCQVWESLSDTKAMSNPLGKCITLVFVLSFIHSF